MLWFLRRILVLRVVKANEFRRTTAAAAARIATTTTATTTATATSAKTAAVAATTTDAPAVVGSALPVMEANQVLQFTLGQQVLQAVKIAVVVHFIGSQPEVRSDKIGLQFQ